MAAVSQYVFVSTDNTDKNIYGGPFLWDGVTPMGVPSGEQSMLLSTALAGGYTFPAASAQQTNLIALTAKAGAAINNNITYLGIASPTNAQAVTQVGALTRQVNTIIRVVLGQLDSTTGT